MRAAATACAPWPRSEYAGLPEVQEVGTEKSRATAAQVESKRRRRVIGQPISA